MYGQPMRAQRKLFKYFTKLITSQSKGGLFDSLNAIFEAIAGQLLSSVQHPKTKSRAMS
jgi:hypothetical protein